MPLATLIPVAVLAAWSLFVWSEGRVPGGRPVEVAATAAGAFAGAWLFVSGHILPALPVLAFSLLPWVSRGRVRSWLLSFWSPAVLALLLVLADWGSGGLPPWLAAAFLLGFFLFAGLLDRLEDPRFPLFESRLLPVALGAVSAAVIGWIWGTLRAGPWVHDEAAYRMQAELFAAGRWTAPSPPLPEFFEQMHVLVTPVFASKYPPGNSLALVPGVWLGLPGLIPLLCTGVTAGLMFALARRLANGRVALLAWLFFTVAPGNLRFRASYLSEVLTGALWLAGFWALLAWRDSGRLRDLLLLVACVGWGAITRPLTMVAFALPVGIAVLRIAAARRLWRQVALASALGAAILGVLPLWSAQTTGDWRHTPLSLYTRQYMPYDVPGFGPASDRPERPLPPVLDRVNEAFGRLKSAHTMSAVPAILEKRALVLVRELWGEGVGFLPVFFVLGLLTLTVPTGIALACALLLFLAHAVYWHPASWGVYYLELYPVVCFFTAAGLWCVISRLAAAAARWRGGASREAPLGALATALFALLFAGSAAGALPIARSRRHADLAALSSLLERVARLPDRRAVVFVRYAPGHDGHASLVVNGPDPAVQRFWLVHDRGAENRRLIQVAPDRTPFLYDEAHEVLARLPAPAPAVPGF